MSTTFVPALSTDEICRGQDSTRCLSDDLDNIESAIDGKAAATHTHTSYLTEDDAVATFAMASHTHTGYAASEHTHTDLVTAIEALDTGKAAATHTHAQSDVTGLVDKLAEIDEAIEALQAGGESGGAPTPMLTLSMHTGKLDNNSGAEVSSSTRICSDPFAVQNGQSYWQVNDKAVNMYVLLYDADEVFLAYLGNFASGAEIAVNTEGAAYMRLGSLLGEYDLTNNFYIYDTDPAGGAVEEEEAFTQADADLLYAPISHTHTEYAASEHTHDYAAADHTHTGFAAAEHTHDGYATTDHTHTGFAAAEHTHALDTHDIAIADDSSVAFATTDTLFDALENLDNRIDGRAPLTHIHTNYAEADHTHTADDITGLPSSVDAYSKTEADSRFAQASHSHDGYAAASHTHSDYLTEDEAVDAFAGINHTHDGYAAADHSHSGYAASGHTHTASQVGAAAASHTHTAAAIGAASASHSHSEYAASNHGHSGYASTSHTHTASEVGAVPASGGTVSGALTVTGDGTIKGKTYTQQILPMDAGSYSIGSSDNRYYSTYLRANPNVSSDLRCKRDIASMDIDPLAAFVDKLCVVSYNYKDDAADEAKRIGLIAQDVVAADPEIAKGCIEQDEKGFYSLRAADLVFPLIAAVQKLCERVEQLESK